MTDDNNSMGLDALLTATPQPDSIPTNEVKESEKVTPESIDDEFAILLNSFIAQTSNLSNQSSSSTENTGGLDGFMTTASSENKDTDTDTGTGFGGLDSFVSSASSDTQGGLDGFVSETTSGGGLDGFVSGESKSSGLDGFVSDTSSSGGGLDGFVTDSVASVKASVEEQEDGLKPEEKELAHAFSNFRDGMSALADRKHKTLPTLDYADEMLIPNYKPSVGKKIAQYLLSCWDILNKIDPENMKRLPEDAGDKEYLEFAESLKDTDMQLIIISYVEILINLDLCDVKYEQKKEALQKNRIKKELYEKYMELQERKKLFIQKVKEKNFPIDAEKLINNYFRVAQKDPDGSFEALTKNPAMFAPIQMEKIKPRFFGLIKVTPEDGIKANQKIGDFIKKLKV